MPAELKHRVDTLAADIGISSSAVWKILIHRSTRALLQGGLSAEELLRAAAPDEKEDEPPARAPSPVSVASADPPPWRRQRAT